MDVFGKPLESAGEFFRRAAIEAAYELGWFDGEAIDVQRHRVRALADVLVAIGVLRREGEKIVVRERPARAEVPRAGWGLLADVIRSERPLPLDDGTAYHAHLLQAGAPAAAELARSLGGTSLLDLGGGAGAYTAAFLDAHPNARATLVDRDDVIALARRELARFGDRVTFVAGDIREVALDLHDVVLLANVLHLHDRATCAQLVATAAHACAPGGVVAIKDLRIDPDRSGPLEGLWFAINMALYTEGGDVYTATDVRGWLAAAGFGEVETRVLDAAPEGLCMLARLPGAMPRAFRRVLVKAFELEADGTTIGRHYHELMPAMRRAQLANPLFAVALDWSRLPRLSRALDRLYDVLGVLGPDGIAGQLGAPTADEFRARTPTLAVLYDRTHYGGFMPLLYAYPADLAYFRKRASERGLDDLGLLDRYLTAPVMHELSHLSRDRQALVPHLDECVAGWLGVYAHPELAYPERGEDDAIYASPWLSQVGQAIARAFGIAAVIRAHAGEQDALPHWFVHAAERLYWDDWRARRTLHFLADTMNPAPWVELALSHGLPADRLFDRSIVRDALRAMCLEDRIVDGAFRTWARVPDEPIVVTGGWMTCGPRKYWVPPGVAQGTVSLASLDEIGAAADKLLG